MSGARLWVDPDRLKPGRLALGGADYRYLARVLRLREGDAVTLFDGAGREARSRVARVDAAAAAIELDVGEARPAARDPHRARVTLLIALLKGEKMDVAIQKATELGVARIVPVAAARSVVRLDGARGATRVVRWRRIAREAARQCERADAPEVAEPVAFADALGAGAADALRLVFHEGARAAPLRGALPAEPPPEIVLAVGPEGGFETREIALAREAGFVAVGLGPRVLRAETAVIAGLAVLGYAVGDLG